MGRSSSIFIGYRRDDTADVSGRVYDRLRLAFGTEAVFKDVDNLDPGVDFGAYILGVLPKCRVFLAMIGPAWLEVRNEAGQRRLDDPGDWVRIELETALSTPRLQVVPVLVNGAAMPRLDRLPVSLVRLPTLNAALVRRDPDFHRDMDKLIRALEAGAATGRVEVEAPPPPTVPTGSQAAWQLIADSLDAGDYTEFQTHFSGTPEVILAGRHRRRLEAWGRVDKAAPEAVAAFLAEPSFPALDRLARETMHRAAEAQQREKIRFSDLAFGEMHARFAAEKVAARDRKRASDLEFTTLHALLADEQPSEFTVILKAVGTRKIDVIKQLRALKNLGLAEAKAFVESTPQVISDGVSEAEGRKLQIWFEAIGAKVEVHAKPVDSAPFAVVLVAVGSRKIEVLKALREGTGCTPAAAKAAVDNLPQVIRNGLSKARAETLKKLLSDAGATVKLRRSGQAT